MNIEHYVMQAFKESESRRRGAIDRLDVIAQIYPNGAKKSLWSDAKELAERTLEHMETQGKVFKDTQGWYSLKGGSESCQS
jgi:hypothetical protein